MKKNAIAAFALGIIAGSVGMTVYTSRDLNSLQGQVQSLKTHVEQLANDNTFLNEQLRQPTAEDVLRSIKVDCTSPSDVSIQSAIEKRVHDDLAFLQGKSVNDLIEHPDLPTSVIDAQWMVISGQKFRLHVTLVIMTHDELYLRVQAQSDRS